MGHEDPTRGGEPAARPPAESERYRRIRVLGQGGFGEVWLAHDAQLGRDVAIKYLTSGFLPEDLSRFRREAQLAARLSHPNIVPVHDVGERFLVMDFIDGPPANEVSSTPREAAEIVRQAAEAVHYAHQCGVIHRDLKPGNILVAKGRAFVTDFGLAKRQGVQSSISLSGQVVGTPAYMSPEQALGKTADIGPRSDVYGLGATLHTLLSGRPPFAGEGPYEILVQVMAEEPPPLANVDRDLAVIVGKAMDKDAARRYGTAAELAADLKRFLDGEAIVARPANWRYRLLKRVRKNPVAWGLGTAVAGVALTALAAIWMLSRGFELSRDAREAIASADQALLRWRLQRYTLIHSLTAERQGVEAAVAQLERAAELQREAHPVWAKLGWARLQLGRTQPAREALDRAVALAPGEGLYRWWRGQVYLAISDDVLNTALQSGDTAEQRRIVAESNRWIEQARQEIGAALSCAEWSGEPVEREIARVVFQRRAEECRRLANTHPQGAETAWYLLALSESASNSRAAWCDEAMALAPSWDAPLVTGSVAWTYFAQERSHQGVEPEVIKSAFAAGVDRAQKAMVINSEDADPWLYRGLARANLANYGADFGEDPTELHAAAVEDFRKAAALRPDDSSAWRCLGTVRLYQIDLRSKSGLEVGDQFKSIIEGELRRARDLTPGAFSGWMTLGAARLAWANHLRLTGGDAEPLLREALEVDLAEAARLAPGHQGVWLHLGQTRLRYGQLLQDTGRDPTEQYRRALDEDFARAIECDPRAVDGWTASADARKALGLYMMMAGQDPSEPFRQAIEVDLARALAIDPGDAGALRTRGIVHMNWAVHGFNTGGDPEAEDRAAIEDLTRSLERNSRNAWVWIERGNARVNASLHRRSDPELVRRAIEEDYARAIELNPRNQEAYKRLAIARLNRGGGIEDLRKAVDEAGRAIALNPTDYESWQTRGAARVNLAALVEASGQDGRDIVREAIERDLTEALRLNPRSEEALTLRGSARLNLGNYSSDQGEDPTEHYRKGLEEDLRRAVELNPRSADAFAARGALRINWGSFLLRQGLDPTEHLRAAIEEDLRRAIELNPKEPAFYQRRGAARSNLGSYEKSRKRDPTPLFRAAIEEDYDRALAIVPDDVEIVLSRGRAYMGWGLYVMEQVRDPSELLGKALAEFTRATELRPASADAWAERAYAEGQRARMFWVYGDRETAVDSLRRSEEGFARSIELNPRSAEAYWHRAYIRAEFGRVREALADYDQALKINPALEGFLKPFIDRARAKLPSGEDF